MNLLDKLAKEKGVLLVIQQEAYSRKMSEVVKKLKNKRICYVSTNTGYDTLSAAFKKSGVKKDNYMVIDCITSSIITTPEKRENCVYLSSPNALTELSLALNVSSKFDFVILDSLSTLMFYHDKETLLKFSNSLINRIRRAPNTTLILVMFSKDKEKGLFQDLSAMVDRVIHYK